VAKLLGQLLLVNQSLHEGFFVKEIAQFIDDDGVSQGFGRERASGPFGEAGLVGVDLIGLLGGVHVEVAVAGFGAGGSAVASAAREAEAEEEGGERGERFG